ncbi:MAG: LacI family transcriptional regulator [Actinobacteria bacterium]|nr:LacI family transcriptional regulator [Actinomycetota bacterium]
MKTRIKDIAKKLEVSESTVSRALADHPLISEETKKKVRKLAKEMRYRPNFIAKSLKLKRTKTIGLIIGDIMNPFYPEITRGAEDIANKYDFNIILCNSDYDPEKEMKYIRVLEEKRVDGILITPVSEKTNGIKLLKESKIPFVLIDTKPPLRIKANCVYVDQEYGAYYATEYLIKNGHRKIALINGPKTQSPCKQLEIGFKKAMNAHHIPINEKFIKVCNLKKDGGYNSMRELLSLKPEERPTAVIFISDITSMGAYDAIEEKGLKVPDISIIGYDNIPESKYLSPPLTTVDQPKYQLGTEAMNILIKQLQEEEKWEPKVIRLIPQLIERKSTLKI